jgi:predicted dehydrogenase
VGAFEPVRFAVVGCGTIARGGYGPRLAAYPRHVTLQGFFDQYRPGAEQMRDAAGGGRIYESIDEVLDDPEVEAVLNLTTIEAHHPITLAALRAGKHVYSEKPISITSEQAAELLRTAEEANLKLACSPSSALGYEQQDVGRRIRAGELGDVHTVFGSFATPRLEAWLPSADIFMQNGVSVVADAAPYPLTMMTTYFGPVARVFGFARIVDPDRTMQVGPRAGTGFRATIPTQVLGLLEFHSGVVGFLNTGWVGRSETPPLEITGSDATFALNPHNDGFGVRMWATDGAGEEITLPRPEKAMDNALDWGKGPVDLAEAIRTDRPPRCSPYQAAHIVEIAEAFNAASEAGRAVELRTTFELPEPVGDVAPWD